jgi:LPS export ABC transporter protein LptC
VKSEGGRERTFAAACAARSETRVSGFLPSGGWRLLFLALVLVFAACPRRAGTEPQETLPDQVISDFRLVETNAGNPVFELVAERATVYEQMGRVDVLAPRVTFFDENRSPYSTITADSGTIFRKVEDLIARGHVRVETSEGTRLLTDSLVWSNRQRRVQTDAAVVFETPSGRIEGQGLVSDAGLEKVEVRSEVRGTADYDVGP